MAFLFATLGAQLRQTLVRPARRLVGRRARPAAPRVVDRVEPVSRKFGFDRGQPIDRVFIEAFLEQHAGDVHGRVLEAGDAEYTRRFGGARVTRSDVLNVQDDPGTTIVAHLEQADHVPEAQFDCVILTQVLCVIYDLGAALRHAWRILRPGGVLLVTVPGVCQISRFDADRWGDYWRFTPQGFTRLLGEQFGAANVTTAAYGNFGAATALLDGRAADEVPARFLTQRDPDFPVLIAGRAVRAAALGGADVQS